MRTRALLWTAFAIVHIGVAVLGWVMPSQPMGDVYLVYEPWSTAAVSGLGAVGITEPWVYPQLALVPMVLAKSLAWIAGYIVGWAILVTVLNAIAFAILVGRGRSTGRAVAAWFWIAAIAALGPVGMYRIDAVTVPLAVVGLLLLVRRPLVASILLSVGTWIKVWPAVLLAAALIVLRRRRDVLLGALLVSAVVAAVVVVLGGGAHLFGFVGEQTGRGLQVEAPVSTPYVWLAALGLGDAFVYYDRDILTYQVTGPQIDAVIALMTPLQALAVLGIAAAGARKSMRGASIRRLLPPLSLALVLALLVFHKVGSPQFQTWLVPPVVLWLVLDRRRAWLPAAGALALLVLTQCVYPVLYHGLLVLDPTAVVVLSLRNLLLVAMLAFVVVRLLWVPGTAPRVRDSRAERVLDPH